MGKAQPKVAKLKDPRWRHVQCRTPKEELDPATIGWKGYRENRARMNTHDPNYCMRVASWEVDNIPLCTQHAGMRVLEALEALNG